MSYPTGQPPSFDIGPSLDVAAIYRAMGQENELTEWLDQLLYAGDISAGVQPNTYHRHTPDGLTHELHVGRFRLRIRLFNRIRHRDPISDYMITRITSQHTPLEDQSLPSIGRFSPGAMPELTGLTLIFGATRLRRRFGP